MKKINWMPVGKVVSMDLGSSCTKIVVGKEKQGKVMIEQAFTIPTPLETYQDGNILQMDPLLKVLTQDLEKTKIKSVICTLESSMIIYRDLFLPISKPKELQQMVQMEIQQNVPVDLTQYVVQGRVLEKVQEGSDSKYRVLAAMVPKELLKKHTQFFDLLKLKPIAIDLHSNGISKIFEKSKKINDKTKIEEKTIAVIDIGYSTIHIVILENGILKFNRLLSMGSQEMDLNIANSFNLTLGEAEKKKLDLQQYQGEKEFSSSFNWLQQSMEVTLEHWVKEIEKIFRYYTSRSFTHVIDAIYLHGKAASMEKVSSYFQNFLNFPVEKIQTMDCIQWEDPSQEIHPYLNAIAALIRK